MIAQGSDTMQFTLKQARLHSDKTQAEMAKLLGICRNKYLNIEKYPDTATIAEAKKISKITASHWRIFF